MESALKILLGIPNSGDFSSFMVNKVAGHARNYSFAEGDTVGCDDEG